MEIKNITKEKAVNGIKSLFELLPFDKKTVPPYVMVFDWYRPTLEQTLKMSDGMIDHILNGGLILDSEKW